MSLDTIPAELLEHIVELAWGSYAQIEDDVFAGVARRQTIELLPFHLASVSRSIRSALLDSPAVWRTIYIKFHFSPEPMLRQKLYLDLVLKRSGSAQLNVFLSQIPGAEYEFQRDAVECLISILPRIRRLAIWTSAEYITKTSLFDQIPQTSFALEYLSFTMNWTFSPQIRDEPLLMNSHRLTELHLCNVDVRLVRLGDFPHLLTLSLTSCVPSPDQSIILDLGRHWPKLQYLTINKVYGEEGPPEEAKMWPLPDLVELDIRSVVEAQTLYYFGYNLVFPSLTTLSAPFALSRLLDLPDRIERLRTRSMQFYTSAVPHLSDLTIIDSYLDDTFVSIVLSGVSRLQTVTFSRVRCSSKLFEAWVTTRATSTLSELRFLDCEFLNSKNSGLNDKDGSSTSLLRFFQYFSSNNTQVPQNVLHIDQVMNGIPNKLSANMIERIRSIVPVSTFNEIHDF